MKTEEIFASTVVMPHRAGSENCLSLGTRLADFEITGILGEGGFGIVYLAFDHSLQRTVAIKEYMPGALAGRGDDASVTLRSDRHQETFSAGLRSFINEARLLAQFDHPALVKVYRFWEQNKTAYMAMRYYDGYTLKDIVNQSPDTVTEPWLKFIYKQILEALETLYGKKILHRDISPDNIIVQKSGDAVLLDFGSARQIIGDMTKGLTVILKPGFAPIEQYSDDASMEQGPWTDIYALAAVLFFAVTKRPPPNSIARIIKDPLEPLSVAKHGEFSEGFLAAIDQGLVVPPEGRPQSIEDFRKLLGIAAASGRGSRSSIGNPLAGKLPGNINKEIPENVQKTERFSSRPEQRVEVQPEVRAEIPPEVRAEAQPEARAEVRPEEFAQVQTEVRDAREEAQAQLLAEELPMLPELPEIVPEQSAADKAKLEKASKKDKKAKSPIKAWQIALIAAFFAIGGGAAYYVMKDNAGDPVATASSASAGLALDQEAGDWEKLKNDPAASAEQISAFVQKYPTGKFIAAANEKLAALQIRASASADANSASAAGAASVADAKTDNPPPAVAGASAGSVAMASASTSASASVPASASIISASASASAVALTTSYKLVVKPWGTVFVDDQEKGPSPPLKKLVLPEGKHKIRIVNPGFPDYLLEIQAGKKKLGTIEHDFSTSK